MRLLIPGRAGCTPDRYHARRTVPSFLVTLLPLFEAFLATPVIHCLVVLNSLVVDYLLPREGLTPVDDYPRPTVKQKILTEEPPWRDSNLRPDIYVEQTQEAFEIETLYGTDHKKINRTIDKYEGWPVEQINIVLPNLTCLRNLEAILRKRQEEPGEMFKNDVKFWTLNLAKQELLPVDELKRTLHDLYDRSEHVI